MNQSHSAAVLALLSAIACRRDVAPAADPNGRAADSAASAPVAPPPLSRFDAPLTYDFSGILRKIETAVPLGFGSLDSLRPVGTDGRKRVSFIVARSAFTTFAQDSEIHLRSTLAYSARAQYKPPIGPTLGVSCGTGKTQPELVVELVAPVTLTPEWHLQAHTRLASIEPASTRDRDKCLVSVIAVDVTPTVISAATSALTAQLPAIDRKIGEVDLTNQATKWWAQLSKPIRIRDGVWLMLHPQQLRLKGVTGHGHVLDVDAGLDAFPAIVTGAQPLETPSPLAPLGFDTADTGFHIAIDGTIDFMSASQLLTKALRKKSVAIGAHVATIRSIVVTREAQGKIALAIAFTGDADGIVRFIGTPRLNHNGTLIRVDDLDFDITTANAVLSAYAWLKSETLVEFFRDKAQLPTAPLIERSKELFAKGLNRRLGKQLTISSTVDSLSVAGLFVTPQGLVIRTSVQGAARLAVQAKK